MIKIKHTFRRLAQNLRISLISVWGFTLSFVLLILIANYVIPVLTADSYHNNRARIVTVSVEYSGYDLRMADLDFQILEEAKDCPFIEAITPFSPIYKAQVSRDGETFIGVKAVSVDTSFFSIFSFELVSGNRKTCLANPFTAVITEQKAKDLFGDTDPSGRSIVLRKWGKDHEYVIEGVIKDYPNNSIFNTELFLSYETQKVLEPEMYNSTSSKRASEMPFMLIREGVKQSQLEIYFSGLYSEREKGSLMCSSPKLHSLKEFYFDEEINEMHFNRADMSKVLIMIALGILVLILSISNYINFLLSITLLRARSNSTMKVYGHSFKHFFVNYLSDTLVLMLTGFLLAIFIYSVIIFPYSIANYELFNCLANSTKVLAVVTVIIILASVVAACVAAILSNKQDVVKKYEVRSRGLLLSNGMLVFQFAIVVFLLICGSTLNRQLHFLQEDNPGFKSENIIYISDYFEGGISKADKEMILKIPGVKSAGFSNWIPDRVATLTKYKEKEVLSGEENEFSGCQMDIDNDAFEMLGFEIIAGRKLKENETRTEDVFLVNEAYMKKAKLDYLNTDRFNAANTIVGVVKDFHLFSKKEVIEPVTIYLTDDEDLLYQLFIELEAGFENQRKVIQGIEEMWESRNKIYPLEWQYLDERINSLYRAENEFTHIVLWLSLFAFMTGLLGLVGMVVFVLSNKTKEIGIRKVNGANMLDILRFVNTRFVRLVFLGYLIGSPIAWWYMIFWLKNFAYKAPLSWWVFALSGLSVLLTVVVTVSWQSWFTARKNPVKTLRYE